MRENHGVEQSKSIGDFGRQPQRSRRKQMRGEEHECQRTYLQVKLGGKPVPDDVMRSILGFMGLYVGLFAFCSVLLAGMGVDFVTSFAAVAATLGNIGPGFGNVGPVENYAQIPYLGKWLLLWCMLLGRLEIYTVIIFLVPEFWRK